MSDETTLPEERRLPTSQPVLLRALGMGAIATAVLMAGFGTVGYLVSSTPGAIGGVLGAALAFVLLGLTIGSIAFANAKFISSENFVVIFFAIVMGAWLVKLVAFIVVVIILRDATWLDTQILFFSLIAGVLVSLIIDVLIVTRTRMPYVSDVRGL
ncbi:3-oxoacyl-ACP reductase [Leucobacter sp. W1153]|uniref:3-oxoacyl-ACP reductase n=1 Tax=Leucobacter sp. W1153 TaxID=3439064 RepID=UPI003F30C416